MNDHRERGRAAQLLDLADQLFADGCYAASHHALLSSLYLAESTRDLGLLRQVGAQASRHRRVLNDLQPDHELADLASARRSGRGVYQTLELRVASLELAWQLESEFASKPPRGRDMRRTG